MCLPLLRRAGCGSPLCRVHLLPNSLATPELLAHTVTAKFVDGIPLYRQESQLDRLAFPGGAVTA